MTREMNAEQFQKKIEALDEYHWQILIGGFLGQSDLEIAKSLHMTEQNVRKHFSKMFHHFDIYPQRGKKRPMLYALFVRHQAVLVEFLTGWEDLKLLVRIYNILGQMKRSEKLKLINKSDSQIISFLAKSLV